MIPIYPLKKGEGLPEKLRSRSQLMQKDVSAAVEEILAAVRARGDEALYEYEERFDHANLRKAGLAVTREEIEAAYRAVEPALVAVLTVVVGAILISVMLPMLGILRSLM